MVKPEHGMGRFCSVEADRAMRKRIRVLPVLLEGDGDRPSGWVRTEQNVSERNPGNDSIWRTL